MEMTKYKDTKPYQNMTDGQRVVLDNADNNGIYGGIRSAKAWKEKRAQLTPEELEEIKQNDKLNEWTSKWALLGIVTSVVLFGIVLVIGEMTGNPLIPY